MNTTILNLQWSTSFLPSSVEVYPVMGADRHWRLTCLRLAWMRFALWWTAGARAERKTKTLPQAQTPEERQRRLYPDRKHGVQSEHRMAAGTIGVWSVQSVTLEGKGALLSTKLLPVLAPFVTLQTSLLTYKIPNVFSEGAKSNFGVIILKIPYKQKSVDIFLPLGKLA